MARNHTARLARLEALDALLSGRLGCPVPRSREESDGQNAQLRRELAEERGTGT